MGSQASPEISDITMFEIENTILKFDNKIVKWWRCRDDICSIGALENNSQT